MELQIDGMIGAVDEQVGAMIDEAVVTGFRCFADLDSAEAAAVASLLRPLRRTSGETIFRQGDGSESVYMVVSGEVAIKLRVPDHDEHSLVTLGPGSIFGEMGPLSGRPRAASAVVVSDADLVELPYRAIEQALEKGERWASKFLITTAKVLAHRLRTVNEELASVLAGVKENPAPPKERVEAELGRLRKRLFTDWKF